jgi:hypothetical protein
MSTFLSSPPDATIVSLRGDQFCVQHWGSVAPRERDYVCELVGDRWRPSEWGRRWKDGERASARGVLVHTDVLLQGHGMDSGAASKQNAH